MTKTMVTCSGCGTEKEHTRKNFYYIDICTNKLDTICIKCKSDKSTERYEKNKNNPRIKEEQTPEDIEKAIKDIKNKEKINIQQSIFYALYEFDIKISYPTFSRAVKDRKIGYILSGTRKYVVIRELLEDWLNGKS